MPPVFPASYSTLDPAALTDLVTEKYGISDVRCQFLLRGVGDTYVIESAAGSFILRVYRSSQRSPEQVGAEIQLLVELKRREVPVAYPISDLSGALIQTLDAIEGPRQAVLFSYAPGQPALRLNEKQLRETGRQMARFHEVSSTIRLDGNRWSFDLETTLFKPLEILKPAFREDPEGYVWTQQAAARVVEKLSEIGTAGFSSGYCHFDFLPKNFHFEGDSVTFFDFDFLGYGWLVNDIMTFWSHLCWDVHFKRMSQEEADEAYGIFLDAYREVRALSEKELEAVPWLALGFWLFYMRFHTTHDQFYPFVQPGHLKLRVAMMRQLMERYWQP